MTSFQSYTNSTYAYQGTEEENEDIEIDQGTLSRLSTLPYHELVQLSTNLLPTVSHQELINVTAYLVKASESNKHQHDHGNMEDSHEWDNTSEAAEDQRKKPAAGRKSLPSNKKKRARQKNDGDDVPENVERPTLPPWPTPPSTSSPPKSVKMANYEESIDQMWETGFQTLLEFHRDHGHCDVPRLYADNKYLGGWVHKQRWRMKKGKLSQERIDRLNELNFKWGKKWAAEIKGKSLDEIWEFRFEQICEYKSEHGHCRVPLAGSRLGKWVNTQRTHQRKGTLPKDRYDRLCKIEFEWSTGMNVEHELQGKNTKEIWQYRVNQLIEYRKRHGHCKVPLREPGLGPWAGSVRTQHRKKKLSKERYETLSEIGFDWGDVPEEVAPHGPKGFWNYRYKQLIEYRKEKGNTHVPRKWKENPKLADWVRRQQAAYKREELPKERIEKLNAIGFDWGKHVPVEYARLSRDDKWEMRYQQLKEYKEKKGNCRVPRNYSVKALNGWVAFQRELFHSNKLPDDRVRKLEDIGFEFTTKEYNPRDWWMIHYNALREFKEKVGHANVPTFYEEAQTLPGWVKTQRSRKRKNLMSEEQIQMLDELGFRWKKCASEEATQKVEVVNIKEKEKVVSDSQQVNNDIWDFFFQQLIEYKHVHGSCAVPLRYSENPPLGSWVSRMRGLRRKQSLSDERIEKLDSIGFLWNNKKKVEGSTRVQKDEESENKELTVEEV